MRYYVIDITLMIIIMITTMSTANTTMIVTMSTKKKTALIQKSVVGPEYRMRKTSNYPCRTVAWLHLHMVQYLYLLTHFAIYRQVVAVTDKSNLCCQHSINPCLYTDFMSPVIMEPEYLQNNRLTLSQPLWVKEKWVNSLIVRHKRVPFYKKKLRPWIGKQFNSILIIKQI